MLLFSAKSIGLAKDETIQELRQASIRSNRDTCRYAAKTLEAEIATLFDLVEDESREPRLAELLGQVVSAAGPLLNQLAEGQAQPNLTEQLRKLPEQRKLSQYLATRMDRFMRDEQSRSTIFNTMFVNDAQGNNVGIYFADPDDRGGSSPVGRNYAYRSYFTGHASDKDPASDREQLRPTTRTHLSAHFKSTSTNKWKVGVSTPIWPVGQRPEAGTPIGVLVLTINLGEFQLLAGDQQIAMERFAALVDGREGQDKGVLIQHPFLESQATSTNSVPGDAGGSVSVVPKMDSRFWDELRMNPGITDYLDPAAEFSGGEKFSGEWIAALQPVHLPVRVGENASRGRSDLWVLVQERSSVVSKPVERLGNKLMVETYIEFTALLCVMLVLWFFVFRLGKSSLSKRTDGSGNLPTSSSTFDFEI